MQVTRILESERSNAWAFTIPEVCYTCCAKNISSRDEQRTWEERLTEHPSAIPDGDKVYEVRIANLRS